MPNTISPELLMIAEAAVPVFLDIRVLCISQPPIDPAVLVIVPSIDKFALVSNVNLSPKLNEPLLST